MKAKSPVEIGLCQTCEHAKVIQNANQSRFYLCLLSTSNPNFAKYPRLPVLGCCGYQPQAQWTREHSETTANPNQP